MSFSYYMFIVMMFSLIGSYEYGKKVVEKFVVKRKISCPDLISFVMTTLAWNLLMSYYFGVVWV